MSDSTRPADDVDPWNPLINVSVGILLDNARESVMVERRMGREPDAIKISPEAYEAVGYLRRGEVRRGVELQLLGKPVRTDNGLHREDVTTVLSTVGR